MKAVGFIGTGGMGSGMAANLIKAGYRLVVNDLRREQAKGLESTSSHDSATALGESLNCAPAASSPLACSRLRSFTTRR